MYVCCTHDVCQCMYWYVVNSCMNIFSCNKFFKSLYYFDSASDIKPYVGVGINYTIFFDEDFKNTPKSLGFSELELDSSFGISVQIGADYQLDDKWHVNASARYIDIGTEANFKIGDVKGSASIDVDPMVYSIMLGYKF